MASIFSDRQYLIKKKFLKLFGSDFKVYDGSGQQILFAHLKAFKLKEDITLFRDESKAEPVIRVKARNIIDFSAAYDFYDARTERKLGAVKRKGWKSIIRDEWVVMDQNDAEIGRLQEDTGLLAFVRRFLTNLIPQTFHMYVNGSTVATYKNNFNPFLSKVQVSLAQDHPVFNAEFAIAMGILLCAIEGKQR